MPIVAVGDVCIISNRPCITVKTIASPSMDLVKADSQPEFLSPAEQNQPHPWLLFLGCPNIVGAADPFC